MRIRNGAPWLAAMLAVWVGPNAGAQVGASFDGTFDAVAALSVLYGSGEWQDRRLGRYPNFDDTDLAYVEPLFEAAFTREGSLRQIVIAKLTPRPAQQYGCHACSPLIGGAVFRQDGERWVLEAAAEIIGPANAWHSTFELVRIGPEHYGVLHQIADVHGGIESKDASLIAATGDQLAIVFDDAGFEAPGPGACGVPAQHLRVGIDTGTSADDGSGYFDLVVDRQWNEVRCRMEETDEGPVMTSAGEVCRRTERYRYVDGSYRLLATETDSCTVLAPRTISLRG